MLGCQLCGENQTQNLVPCVRVCLCMCVLCEGSFVKFLPLTLPLCYRGGVKCDSLFASNGLLGSGMKESTGEKSFTLCAAKLLK